HQSVSAQVIPACCRAECESKHKGEKSKHSSRDGTDCSLRLMLRQASATSPKPLPGLNRNEGYNNLQHKNAPQRNRPQEVTTFVFQGYFASRWQDNLRFFKMSGGNPLGGFSQ